MYTCEYSMFRNRLQSDHRYFHVMTWNRNTAHLFPFHVSIYGYGRQQQTSTWNAIASLHFLVMSASQLLFVKLTRHKIHLRRSTHPFSIISVESLLMVLKREHFSFHCKHHLQCTSQFTTQESDTALSVNLPFHIHDTIFSNRCSLSHCFFVHPNSSHFHRLDSFKLKFFIYS